MRELPDPEQIVDQYWPRHGPYSPAHTETATHVLGELVRYLNYATGPGADRALPFAVSVYNVVGGLRAAVGALEQTLRQLAERTAQLREDPRLGHCDRRREPGEHQAARVQAAAARQSLGEATHAVGALYEALTAAQSHLAWLYHKEPDDA